MTPATASVAAGATQQFSAVGRMSDNSTTAVTVTWSATGGSDLDVGLYTAGTHRRQLPGDRGAAGGDEGGHECGDGHDRGPAAAGGGADGPDVVAGGERAGAERERRMRG